MFIAGSAVQPRERLQPKAERTGTRLVTGICMHSLTGETRSDQKTVAERMMLLLNR
jgi:hypothetical protein